MTSIVNLKDRPLRAAACGNCKGSSSDSRVRVYPTTADDLTAASTTASAA